MDTSSQTETLPEAPTSSRDREENEAPSWEHDTPVYDRLGWKVWVMGGLMALIGVITAVLMAQEISPESYLYLVFYSIPSNAAITIFPHEPALIYFGTIGNIWLAAAAGALGTAIAGYMDHTVFVPVLNLRNISRFKEKRLYRASIRYFIRWPFATIFVTGFTPIPFWPFKFLSFSIHYPMWKYLTALMVARFPRYLFLAWLGAAFEIPNSLILGSFLVVILLYIVNLIPPVVRGILKRRSGAAG